MPQQEKSDFELPVAEGLELELGVPIPGKILPPTEWVRTAIKRLPEGKIRFEEWFSRQAPLILEIGCGNGRFVLSSAVRRPDFDHVGIDILPVVIRYATRRANQRGLQNTRFAVCDGERFLHQHVTDGSVSEVHVYHPQPVHEGDSRNHEQRLLHPKFLAAVHRCLKMEGQLFLQTDSRPYWDYAQKVIPTFFEWNLQEGPWPDDPWGRSRREIQALQRKLKIYRGVATKAREIADQELAELLAMLSPPNFHSDRRRHRRRR